MWALTLFFSFLFLGLQLVDLFRRKLKLKYFLVSIFLLLALLSTYLTNNDYLNSGFSVNEILSFSLWNGDRAFGLEANAPLGVVVSLMFVSIILGMVANYFFHKTSSFQLIEFSKPLVVSPIVLLPMVGAIGDAMDSELQLISILLLAFQNGFFWKEIFKKYNTNVA